VLDEWERRRKPRRDLRQAAVRVSTLDRRQLAWTYVLVAYEALPSCQYLG